jgi:hypothetical protein
MNSLFMLAFLALNIPVAQSSSVYMGGVAGRDDANISRIRVGYQGEQVRSCSHVVGAVPMAYGIWTVFQGECYFTYNRESAECSGAHVEFRHTGFVRDRCLRDPQGNETDAPQYHQAGIVVYSGNKSEGRFYRHTDASLMSLSEIRALLDRLPCAGSRPLGNMEVEFVLDNESSVILDVYRSN